MDAISDLLLPVIVATLTAYTTTFIQLRSERRKLAEGWRVKVLEEYYASADTFQKAAQQFAIGLLFYQDNNQSENHIKYFIPKSFNLTLGRWEENDLVVADQSVSRLHCMFSADERNVYVEDLFPTNKTKVNGTDITSRRRLRDGDIITVGRVECKFKSVAGWLR